MHPFFLRSVLPGGYLHADWLRTDDQPRRNTEKILLADAVAHGHSNQLSFSKQIESIYFVW
jgi:hypothetical protein